MPLTQGQKVINWLNNHPYIDRYTAMYNLRITNLTAVISDLRQKGHDIETVEFKTKDGIKYAKWAKGASWRISE